jgi:diaminohydroxyphosphoribosylaminopyrimidine deaminase/5-amino-6-(5-phosphoribosylamino)uracil reductase
MPSDERWMARALELAARGVALAHPNPLVGAVVVKGGRAVGEGFHTYDGLRHAEAIALDNAGGAARGATLYVTLEPCCHTGRTGPCTRAIRAAGVGRVVAAMRDPNPRVAGRGLAELRRARLRVEVGPGEAEARRLNEAFARWIRTRRPFVTLKTAMTLDGKIAAPGRRWITSPEARAEVQRMRHAADAVLTGIGTVLADNPRLTDRTGLPRRRPLARVVLDARLRLPLRSRLVRSARGDVLVFTAQSENSPRARRLRRAGVEVMRVAASAGRPDLRAVLRELGRREILSVLVEAGATLNEAALRAGVVDKLALFVAPKVFGARATPFLRGGRKALAAVPPLGGLRWRRFGPDFYVEGYLRNVYGNH